MGKCASFKPVDDVDALEQRLDWRVHKAATEAVPVRAHKLLVLRSLCIVIWDEFICREEGVDAVHVERSAHLIFVASAGRVALGRHAVPAVRASAKAFLAGLYPEESGPLDG